jgi:hypothetical protein
MAGDHFDYEQLIDACRSPGDVERTPELRPLADGLEENPALREKLDAALEMDLAIARGLERVAVPQGLADRVLASLQQTAETPVTPQLPDDAPATKSPSVTEPGRETAVVRSDERRRRRRTIRILAGCVAAAAATLLVAALWYPRDSSKLTEREMRNSLVAWVAVAGDSEWRVAEFPLRRFPLTRSMRVATPRRWSPIRSAASDDDVVCYDLDFPGDPVLLFVVRTHRKIELPVVVPAQPISSTQNLCLAAWQEQGLVYGLAVEGDSRRWQTLPWSATRIAFLD